MGIKISYRLALMSIFLCLFIQAPQSAHGQAKMNNGAGGTCSALSKKSTDKISETLDNLMDVMIEKFQNVYSSISPAGLYHILGLLVNVADENSKSLKEIEEGWMVKKKENKPNDLFNFNREIKKLNFNSSVLYYYPKSLGKPSSKLSFVVKESGGLLFQEKGTVNYQISKKTGERLKNYELPENEKSNVILNIVSFTFQWVDDFVSVTNEEFVISNKGKVTLGRTMYTKSDVPYFEKKNCKAVQLYLKGQDGKRIEGMSVYLIDTFGKLLTMIAWDEAFVGLKKGGKTKNGFQMLKFNLDAEIKFDTNFFPKLLSAGNTEFKSVADTVEFKFRQKILSCVDQNGSRGQGIPSKSKENISLPENVDWFLFSDFYFIIADDMIGIPYLIHKIDKSLESKESC